MFEQKPGYLLAKVTGDADSLEISRQYWAEVLMEVEKRQPKALLVWEDLQTMVSTPEVFILVNELCEYIQYKHIKVAYLDTQLDQLDRNKLGEMVATNRGFCARVCSKFEDAERWLLQN